MASSSVSSELCGWIPHGGEQTLAIRGELDGPAAGRQVISDYNRGGHAGAVCAPPPDLLGVAAELGRVQVDVRIEYGQLN